MDGKMKLQRDPTTVRTNLTVIECAFSSDNAFLSSISWQQRMIDAPEGRICNQVFAESHMSLIAKDCQFVIPNAPSAVLHKYRP